ncbi:conserved hypothetical protein [Flavobacterium sp. 9AF]|nr:conserved hypothetical protein [Flavobacterium sp. 9AF]
MVFTDCSSFTNRSSFNTLHSKKYEENKIKYGFHLYIKKRIGVVWNLLTYDKFSYKKILDSENLDDLSLTFDEFIKGFEKDYSKNKETIHPLFAFGILLNFQNILFTIHRIKNALKSINIENLDEKTLEFGDKLSKKEHHKLNAIFMLIEHYYSIITFHDKFDSLKSVQREIKEKRWIGLKVEKTVLKNQGVILDDLKFLRENEISINEILNINKLLIQEMKSYFEYDKLKKKRKMLNSEKK